MITLDLSILNQKGTPMFYSDTLALRPAFGIVGRIFIATDSPYGIFRDTGSAWDQIASAGSGVTGSGTLNTIAMFTPSGTAIGNSLITQSGINISVARNLIVTNGSFTLSHIHPSLNGTVNPLGEQIGVTNTFQAGITWTALLACFNSSSLQTNLFNGSVTFGNGSYTTNNLNLSNITFNAAGSTITSTQASGGIRAYANQILQLRIDGTNNGTYTHYANSAIYGDFASSTARFTITNRYGYLVNNLDEYSAGHTYTNRWAFYNAGINDNNFFAGKVGIGSGYVPSTFQLDVLGTARIGGDLTVFTSGAFPLVNIGTSTLRAIQFSWDNGASAGYITTSTIAYPIFFRASAFEFLRGASQTPNLKIATDGKVSIAASGGGYLSSLYEFSVNGSLQIIGLRLSNSTGYTDVVAGTARGFRYFTNDGLVQYQNTFVSGNTNFSSLGTFSEDTSALLKLESITKGFLPPKMTTTEKNNIATPVSGLVVFDTTLVKLCVYNGATWETVTSI